MEMAELRAKAIGLGWVALLIPAGYLGFYLAGAAMVHEAAAARPGRMAVAAAVAGIVNLGLSACFRRLRAEQGRVVTLVRRGMAGIQLALGLALVVLLDADSWTFLGIALVTHASSAALSEARYSRRWVDTRGRVALALAVLLVVLGLGPIGAIGAPAGLALAAFGILTAAIATELVTEDWLDLHRLGWVQPGDELRESWKVLALRGVVLLLVAAGLLAAGGMEPAYLALLLVGTVVVMALVASDSDVGVLVAVVLVAAVWALSPRSVPVPEVMEVPRPGEPFIVALGDSYISGEGASRYIDGTNSERAEDGTQCRRAPTAYPVTLVERATVSPDGSRPPGTVEIPHHVFFVGCSGALAGDLWRVRSNGTDPVPQLTRYHDLVSDDRGSDDTLPGVALDEADVRAVLLSVGGNDAGFGDLGKACVAPGECADVGLRFVENLARVGARLDAAYDHVAAELEGVPLDADGHLPVYVLPYPMPLKGGGCWWTLLSAREHDFIRAFVDDLNDTIQRQAEAHGFTYVAAMESSLLPDQLRICDRDTPKGLGMNFFALNPVSGRLKDVLDPTSWIHSSFHPNAAGHEAMRTAVVAALTRGELGANNDYEELSADELVRACPEAYADDGAPTGADRPRACDQATFDWVWTETLRLARFVLPALTLALLGAWSLLLPPLRRARAGDWSTLVLPMALVRALRSPRGRGHITARS